MGNQVSRPKNEIKSVPPQDSMDEDFNERTVIKSTSRDNPANWKPLQSLFSNSHVLPYPIDDDFMFDPSFDGCSSGNVSGNVSRSCSVSADIGFSSNSGGNSGRNSGGNSGRNSVANSSARQSSSKSRWRHFEDPIQSRAQFIEDKSMPFDASDSMFEMRLFMNDRELLRSLMQFMSTCSSLPELLCWLDIQSYKAIMPEGIELQKCRAVHICEKYLKGGAPFMLNRTDALNEMRIKVDKVIGDADDSVALAVDLFTDIQWHCFIRIYDNVWFEFHSHDAYNVAIGSLRSYNQIHEDDFEYLEKLGHGGYGCVVHAVKRSTGKHYAMKIQRKLELLDAFSEEPHRVTFERQAIAKCRHPFIIGLDYAFQTEDLVVMALELGRTGTLLDSLNLCKNLRMSQERVRFYAAELVLGLSHMHRMGFIFRDLKPENVLLFPDGNVKLADLGGVVDPQERVLKHHTNVAEQALHLMNEYATETDAIGKSSWASVQQAETESPNDTMRAMTIMGTMGYMAPEMLKLAGSSNRTGYSQSVDWWSLGMTIVELLTGKNSFKKVLKLSFRADLYAKLFKELKLDTHVSAEAYDIIASFLVVDASHRLGSGNTGFKDIKIHPFFAPIKWYKLGDITPPFLPKVITTKELSFPSFDDMIAEVVNHGKGRQFSYVSVVRNKHFENWDYVSHESITAEEGLDEVNKAEAAK